MGLHPRNADLVTFTTLVAGPPALLAVLHFFSEGRDLTVIFLIGLGVFFTGGIYLVVSSVRVRNLGVRVVGTVVLVSVLVCFFIGAMGKLWVGNKAVEIIVQVADAESGLSIADAKVLLLNRYADSEETEGRTDKRGEARLRHTFWAYGDSSPVSQTGVVVFSRDTLTVEAEGYDAVRASLAKFTGPYGRYHDSQAPIVEVALYKTRQ
jgi:hypothetical protein